MVRRDQAPRQSNIHARTPTPGPGPGPAPASTPYSIPKDGSASEYEDDDASIRPVQRRPTLSKTYTTAEERAVLKKLDRRLVLFLAFLYLLSFLDRSNIGNARIAGLEKALDMSSRQYNTCLLAFYITYITFEWMILLYRLVPAHVYISCCVLAWGLVASLQSVVTSFRQLVVLRALLGVTEAAFGPGVPFYMTFFYRREELAYRVGLQISAAPLATSFASSLAWVIMKIARGSGLDQWRALFLVEGFPSIITAVLAWYWIPDGPATARWLSPRERKIASLRVRPESSNTHAPATSARDRPVRSSSASIPSRINWTEIKTTLLDPKSYLTSLMFLSVNVSFSSLPVFLPTIIRSMSFSPLTSQLLSAPPYLVSFFFVLWIGHLSDKKPHSRGIFLCAVALLSSLSYATIALAGAMHHILGDALSIPIRYVAVYGAAMGLFASVVLIITWTLNNQQSSTGKGVGMVILNVVGQCGPLIGVELFPRRQGPLYVPGMAVCGVFMGLVAVLSFVLRVYLRRLNRANELGGKTAYEMVGLNSGASSNKVEAEEEEEQEEAEGLMGHESNDKTSEKKFVYML